jgi:hypothetical protein
MNSNPDSSTAQACRRDLLQDPKKTSCTLATCVQEFALGRSKPSQHVKDLH